MPVIFDEVIANVEAPPAGTATDDGEEAGEAAENQQDQVIRIIETRQRWAQRLIAD